MNNQVKQYALASVALLKKYNPDIKDVYIGGSVYLNLIGFSNIFPNDIDIMCDKIYVKTKVGVDAIFDKPEIIVGSPTLIADNVFLLNPIDQCINIFKRINTTYGKYTKWVDFFKSLSVQNQTTVLNNIDNDNTNKKFLLSL